MTRKENQSVVFANQNRNLLPEDLPKHTVANAPDPAINDGRLIYVSDGGGGLPIVAFSDGTNWLRSDTLSPIFDPIDLFASGEQGVLFDRMNPADGFLFQDSAGTIPCTAAGQPVGRMLDRSQGPIGPEEVVNGTFDNDLSGWFLSVPANITWDAGRAFYDNPDGINTRLDQTITTVVGAIYPVTFDLDAVAQTMRVEINGNSIGTSLGSGSFSFEFVGTGSDTIRFRRQSSSGVTQCFIDNVSIKELPGNHALQSVNDDFRPTIEQDGNGNWYLDYDGADDAMQTASIDWTGTDQVSFFITTQRDADDTAIFIESSVESNANDGAFSLLFINTETIRARSRGTTSRNVNVIGQTTPDTNVYTVLADISDDELTLRKNGSQIGQDLENQGPSNYLTYPLYIGSRAGTSLHFTGRFYGICVLGRTATAQEISDTETYFGNLAGLSI